jgi:hypothetical protein
MKEKKKRGRPRKAKDNGKHPGGRPPEYDPTIHPKIVQALAAEGKSNRKLAKNLGIGEKTFYLWQSKYSEFRDAIKAGKEWPDDMVEASLFQRAIGYSHPAQKIMVVDKEVEIVDYTEHYPPDTNAAEFWLTNRRPKVWKHKQEITGADEGPIEILFAKELQDV